MMTPASDSPHLDHTLQALADPTRRAILDQLARGPARVTALAAPFEMSLNSVSKHIRVLERAGLVRRRRRGREHILALDPRPLDDAARWIEEHRALWTARLDTLEAILRAEGEAARQTGEPRSTAARPAPDGRDCDGPAARRATPEKGTQR